MASSLPYQEPGIVNILVYSSFLLLLCIVNYIVDRILYCGLIGQILLGVAFGTPGSGWLSLNFEEVATQLGYLGLILLVYEGGLSTDFRTLKANLLLSSCIAVTGIAAPIALSFVLQALFNATSLQAFAAGAALCSTSLGTTFAILNASDLSQTRLGVVLSTAAMLDDIVGLIMVQVISNLGATSSSFEPVTVIRPVFVSIAFAVTVPLLIWTFSKLLVLMIGGGQGKLRRMADRILHSGQSTFLLHTLYLLGLVTAASYAGTSNLFSAYIAGATISWWDSEVQIPDPKTKDNAQIKSGEVRDPVASDRKPAKDTRQPPPDRITGLRIYEEHYRPAVDAILKPLFFASIGFSIPITRMFSGRIIWRGIVYTCLMLFGKLLCGCWLIRLGTSRGAKKKATSASGAQQSKTTDQIVIEQTQNGDEAETKTSQKTKTALSSPSPPAPISLYPAAILGCAMTARGEIGFLISSLAESTGIFQSKNDGGSGLEADRSEQASEIFLIITWAIMLCTLLGPLCTGLLVKRVKALEMRREPGSRDVLGVWGVVSGGDPPAIMQR